MLLDDRGYPDNKAVKDMFARLLEQAGVPTSNPDEVKVATEGLTKGPVPSPSLLETLNSRLPMLVRSAIFSLASHQMQKHASGRFHFHKTSWEKDRAEQRLLSHFCLCPVDDRTRNLNDTVFQGFSPEQAIRLCFEPDALAALLYFCPNTYTFWQQVMRTVEHTLDLPPLPLPVSVEPLSRRLFIDYTPFGPAKYSNGQVQGLKEEIKRQYGRFLPEHLPAPLACDYLQKGLILQDNSDRWQKVGGLVVNPLWSDYVAGLLQE